MWVVLHGAVHHLLTLRRENGSEEHLRESKSDRNFSGLFTVITYGWIKRRGMVNEMSIVFGEEKRKEGEVGSQRMHCISLQVFIGHSLLVCLCFFSLSLSCFILYTASGRERRQAERIVSNAGPGYCFGGEGDGWDEC